MSEYNKKIEIKDKKKKEKLEIKMRRIEERKQKKELKRVERNRNRINKSWIVWTAISLFLIGIISVLGAYFIPDSNELEVIKQIVSTLGQIIISISVTAFLFEHFGYVDYAVKRLCEVFTRDEIIKNLSRKRKQAFKNQLMKDLYLYGSEDEDSAQLVSLVENDINKMLTDYYYTEYITYVDVFLEEIDNIKYFHKIIRRTFTVKPVREGKKCNLERLLTLRAVKTANNSNINLKSLKINNKEIDSQQYEFKLQELMSDSDCYDIFYNLYLKDEKLIEFNESLDLDMLYETYAPYSDKVYSVRIDKPCKHFCCHFNIDTNIFDITLKGYSFMCCGNEEKNRKREIKTLNGKMLRFLSWILPGDGIIAIIGEK